MLGGAVATADDAAGAAGATAVSGGFRRALFELGPNLGWSVRI